MKSRLHKAVLCAAAALTAMTLNAAPPQFQRAQPSDSIQVMFVGNSYTMRNNLPELLRRIAGSLDVKIAPSRGLKGGQSFKGHWNTDTLRAMLADGGFNYVVLQEASYRPSYSTRYVIKNVYPYAHKLDSLAHAGSPDAKVIYYMTWGHRDGLVHHKTDYPLDDTYPMMQQRLKTSYLEMAHDNHGLCAPVGMAWERVRTERPEIDLYVADHHHPSLAGSYLAANVILTTILNRPYTSQFYGGLPAETAEYLQRVAQETVFANRQLIGLPVPE